MKTKGQIIILFLLSVLLIFGTGCSSSRRHHKSKGQLISSKPNGRLQPGEIDNMSGKRNEMPMKKNEKAFEVNKKSMEKDKKSEEKIRKQYEPWQNKKRKRR